MTQDALARLAEAINASATYNGHGLKGDHLHTLIEAARELLAIRKAEEVAKEQTEEQGDED